MTLEIAESRTWGARTAQGGPTRTAARTIKEFALVLGLSFLVLAVPTALAVLTSHVLSDDRVEAPAAERPTLQLRGEPGG